MKRLCAYAITAAVLFGFAACANMQTIGRNTTVPGSDKSDKTDGVAIHLDAQQRLVLVKANGQYCAEPSPDALAAYASSLGLGVSDPSKGAASLANALQGSAGSIGLRTQSITLMRDQLYRMCEAYENGVIGPVQVSMLLGRSQDLTAVILAIEQLTGAVAANQVILTGAAGSGASASLLSNQKLLDEARKNEDDKKASLDTAKKNLEDLQKADPAKDPAEIDKAKSDVQTKQTLYEDAKKTRETIETIKDSAITSAAANTAGAGQFSTGIAQRNALSKEATESIAKAVQGMVVEVLQKDYTSDSCMGFLTAPPKYYDQRDESTRKVRELCEKFVAINLTQQMIIKDPTFRPDAATDTIQKALKTDPTMREKLNKWLADKGKGIDIPTMLYGQEYADLRKQAISEVIDKQTQNRRGIDEKSIQR